MVVPQSGFTALHIAAMGEVILAEPEVRDTEVAVEILGLLLKRYGSADEINAQSADDLMTALHIAVQQTILEAVRLLREMEQIQIDVENVAGQTAIDIGYETLAESSKEGQEKSLKGEKVNDAEEFVKLLEEHIAG